MNVHELAKAWAAVPQISSIHASADGKWAFYCASGLNEVDEVYAVPTDGSVPPEQLTFGTDHYVIRDVSADGSILVLGQSRHASEHDHLLLLDRKVGNRLRLLTPKQNDHYVYGGRLTPDGKAVLFCTDYDYETEKVVDGGIVWLQDLATGTRRALARSAHFFDIAPSFSPDGTQILLNLNDRSPGSTQLWVVNLDGSELREVLRLGETNNTRGKWVSDNLIAFVSDVDQSDKLGLLTLSDGAVEWLGGEPGFCPHEIIPGSEGGFACITHDHSRIAQLVWQNGTLSPLSNTSGRRSLLVHAGLPGGGWLAEAYDADAPHDLVRIDPTGATQTLTTVQPSMRRHRAPRDFRWTSVDGLECQGWLYLPDTPTRGFIVCVHGGPTWHSEDWVNREIGFWVQLGYTVLDPNYRGSTGFGHEWREAVKVDGWGGREQDDIRTGIEAALAQDLAQVGKIAVAGLSYGGFSSWFAIAQNPDLVRAAIPVCGMYRLDIDYHETGMPHGRAYSEEMMGGTPEQFPEKYAKASPGNFIGQIKGHLLIVHGLADSNVGPENTHTAVRELAAAGIPHEVLLFENEGHGIYRRSNVVSYLVRAAAFLERAFDGETP